MSVFVNLVCQLIWVVANGLSSFFGGRWPGYGYTLLVAVGVRLVGSLVNLQAAIGQSYSTRAGLIQVSMCITKSVRLA